MNIAIFSDAFFPQINGVVTSIMSIAENMTARGHKVIIIAPKYHRVEEFNNPKIMVKRIASIPANFYEDFRWTATVSYSTYSLLRKEEVDIIHFMTPLFTSYLGIKFGRLLGIPVVGTFHTFISNPAYYEHLLKGPIKISEEVAWRYCNMYYNAADYITAPTQKAVDIISANGCTVPIEAISNGIDSRIFDNRRVNYFKETYRLKDKVILYIGRIAHEKNLKVLIDAYGTVKKSISDAQLLIIGDGPQMEEFSDYARQNHSDDEVIFAGAMGHEDLVKSGVFDAVSLFATPSVTETQGITILEAQVNGVISIGVNEGGVVDLIENGVNGYLTEPNNSDEMAEKITYILENFDSLGDMKAKAQEMAQLHDMPQVIDRWEELYIDLIKKNQAGELPKKDYLHFATLTSILMDFKLDMDYFRKLFTNQTIKDY